MKTKLLKSTFILLASLLAPSLSAQVQEVIYHETFGDPLSNTNVNTYDGYSEPGVTYHCINDMTDVRSTHPSSVSEYTLASEGGNVLLNNNNKTLHVTEISIADYTHLEFSFGLRKNRVASNGSELELRIVIDGDTSSIIPISLPTGVGTAIYHWVEIPSSFLYDGDSIGFVFGYNSISNIQFRIDDLYLTGVKAETLPISLTHFDVKTDQENLFFDWKTSMEYDLSHYEIEHSANGKDFSYFAQKTAHNHAWGATYELRLMNEYSDNAVRYFRLKSVDLDGSFSYSKVVSLFQPKDKTMDAIPNYFSKNEILRLDASWNGSRLMLYDVNGRVVLQHDPLNEGNEVLFHNLRANQLYILVLKDSHGKQYSKKLMLLP